MKNYKKLILFGMLLACCVLLFWGAMHWNISNIDVLKHSLLSFGKLAPFVFFGFCVFRSFLLLPCGVFSVAAGLLFGPLRGGLLTLAGFTANSLIVYYMSSYFGRDWAKRLLKDKFEAMESMVSSRSFLSFLFLRIVPLLPFDAVSCIGGISKARVTSFGLATLFGSIPGVFIYTYFGDSLKTLSWHKMLLPAAVILMMTLVPIGYKLYKFKKKAKAAKHAKPGSTI